MFLPHSRGSGVADTVCAKHDRVGGNLLRVSSGGLSNPCQSENEAGGTHPYDASSSKRCSRKDSRQRTSEPLPEQKSNPVVPWEEIDQEDAENVRDEVDAADIRAGVRVVGGDTRACEDGNDLNDTVNATQQSRLKVAETEASDDELLLVGKRVGDVVEGREESEEPSLRIPAPNSIQSSCAAR